MLSLVLHPIALNQLELCNQFEIFFCEIIKSFQGVHTKRNKCNENQPYPLHSELIFSSFWNEEFWRKKTNLNYIFFNIQRYFRMNIVCELESTVLFKLIWQNHSIQRYFFVRILLSIRRLNEIMIDLLHNQLIMSHY